MKGELSRDESGASTAGDTGDGEGEHGDEVEGLRSIAESWNAFSFSMCDWETSGVIHLARRISSEHAFLSDRSS